MARKPAPPLAAPTLALEGDLDVFSIHQQWEQLQPLLSAGGEAVLLDLKGIGDVDLSGVQLLTGLARDLREKGTRLTLTGTQEAWKARFEPLGLAGIFEGEAP